mgnify:CR=1 FL=1
MASSCRQIILSACQIQLWTGSPKKVVLSTHGRRKKGLVKEYQAKGWPILSVDCKKKEKIGNFKNQGKTWRPKGEPIEVNVYDFPDLSKGKAIPYGTYDISRNEGSLLAITVPRQIFFNL